MPAPRKGRYRFRAAGREFVTLPGLFDALPSDGLYPVDLVIGGASIRWGDAVRYEGTDTIRLRRMFPAPLPDEITSEWIWGLIQSRGLDAKSAAEAMGVPARTVQQWVSGEFRPSGKNLAALYRWAMEG